MEQQPASNYNLTSATLDINKRPINLTGSRIYDSSTTASASDLTTITNLVGSKLLRYQEMVFMEIQMQETKNL